MFMYNIGDRVYFRTAEEECKAYCKIGDFRLPICFAVVGRCRHEDADGIVDRYTISGRGGQVHEIAADLLALWSNLNVDALITLCKSGRESW